MNVSARGLFRIFLCVALIVSLYGGLALLTAAMFAKGFTVLAVISGLVLSVMTAMALGLFGLAWSMLNDEPDEDLAQLLPLAS